MSNQNKLDAALDRLYEAMKNGDRERQVEGKRPIWGEKDWFETPREEPGK